MVGEPHLLWSFRGSSSAGEDRDGLPNRWGCGSFSLGSVPGRSGTGGAWGRRGAHLCGVPIGHPAPLFDRHWCRKLFPALRQWEIAFRVLAPDAAGSGVVCSCCLLSCVKGAEPPVMAGLCIRNVREAEYRGSRVETSSQRMDRRRKYYVSGMWGWIEGSTCEHQRSDL